MSDQFFAQPILDSPNEYPAQHWVLDDSGQPTQEVVRQAYLLCASDPYKALKTTLKSEIDPDTWATLNSDTSHPFPKPSNGGFTVKVKNHSGDEVMKVFKV